MRRLPLASLAVAVLVAALPGAARADTACKPSGKQVRAARLLDYRAFGERINLSGGAPGRTDPSFQNRTYDSGLGVYDYRNRSFDPATGRFLQRDPVLGGDELYNPYCFPGNNPVTNADPMGLEYLYEKDGVAYWQCEEEGKFWNSRAGKPIPVGLIENGNIQLFTDFGGGTISYGSAEAIAKSHAYMEGLSSRVREDRIREAFAGRGVVHGKGMGQAAREGFKEGYTGAAIITANVMTFEKSKFLRKESAKYEAQGADYVATKWIATGSRELFVIAGTAGAGAYVNSGRYGAEAINLAQKGVTAYEAASGGYMIGRGADEVGQGLASGDDARAVEGARQMLGGSIRVAGALANAKSMQDADTARAAVKARDRELIRQEALPAAERNRIAATSGAAKPGVLGARESAAGTKVTGVSGDECAEDAAVRAIGGNEPGVKIAPAVRPRTMERIPPCERCEGRYGDQLMRSDNDF